MTDKYLKISQLARLLNDTLEMYIGESFFEGELQEIMKASSGHCYCTIKDELSSLSIVLWASSVRQLKFKPEKGMLVRCQGKPNVYSKSGKLQIVVSKMEPAGEGALQAKFDELRKKLAAEGLFALERKRPIPFIPKAIGLVTSAQGAVVHDIMTRLQDRMAHIPVFLVDTRVQGEGAANEIANAIKYFGESGKVDVIICARGGGSLQDLWCFNEEIVVRAIFASKVPVISAVGHEVDVTLADLAADVRAPTPTAAAEMVVPKRQDLIRILTDLQRRLSDYSRYLMPKAQELDEIHRSLQSAVTALLHRLQLRFEVVTGKLKLLSPQNLLQLEQSRLSKLSSRLESSLKLRMQQSKSELERLSARMDPLRKVEQIKLERGRLQQLQMIMASATFASFESKRSKLLGAASKLEALNPFSVMQRGYSITRKRGQVLTSVVSASKGDALEIQVKDGTIAVEAK